MKNDYKICGDVSIAYIVQRNGNIIETFIDTEDIVKLKGARLYYGNKYIYVSLNGENLKYQRFITNCPKGKEVDHINRNTLDNRKINLRICEHAENMQNRSINKNNKSGIRGVAWHKTAKKWKAEVRINGKPKYLGLFQDKYDAMMAVKEARLEFMPFSKESQEAKIYAQLSNKKSVFENHYV